MYEFAFHRAADLDAAASLLANADDGRVIAGGQTLVAAMKLRLSAPSDLVDISGIASLAGIRVDRGAVVIGAMTTHAAVAASADVLRAIPALADLAGTIGDRMVRNRGTIGGSVANNDPAADYPAAVLALGATVITTQRSITADDFFTGMYETALEPGEIITAVSFPIPRRAGYAKFPNPASRYALAGVFVADFETGARIGITGGGGGVFRDAAFEEALTRNFSPAAIEGLSVYVESLSGDLHASAEYRAHLVGVMAKRAVTAALADR
jgi:carbon-monoxide dehydrogenase medium subunit